MFYIDKFKYTKRTRIMASYLIPAVVVFLAFASLSIWSWQIAKHQAYEDQRITQDENIEFVTNAISSRINTYEETLRAGASIFSASDTVTRQEWVRFASIFDLPNRYPGIQGVGFAKLTTPASREAFIHTVRTTDYPEFRIYPESEQPVQVSLLYMAPSASPYPPSIGYDIYSEPTRRRAMDEARDNARPAITEKTTFISSTEENAEPSFIMYFPVYDSDQTPSTVEQRRAQVTGFIYAPFRSSALFSNLDNTKADTQFGYQVYSGNPDKQQLLYESRAFQTIQNSNPRQNLETATLKFGDSEWTVQFNKGLHLGSPELRRRPANALWGGLLFSAVVASLIYVVLASRARKLVYADEAEIQDAKDELLALASHQLRTPATGVKQYVGMLREGFAGTLTTNQHEILNKAYESNERQLNTINEMLSVARADSGRLLLEKNRMDIGKLINDITAEQKKAFEQLSQTVSVILPKKPVYYAVDPQYFRMAVENILNNANKYTPPGGTITVRLKRTREEIQIHIEDTGVGVEERDYPLLFKKFSRIPNELTGKVSGSGIGLYLAKSIVEEHNGHIDFSSKISEGSLFVVSLPLSKEAGSKPAKRQ